MSPVDRTGQAWLHPLGEVLLVVGPTPGMEGEAWEAVWLDSLELVQVSEDAFREEESAGKRRAYSLTKVWG